jgi:outer membrane receptor protein involved in Fe transport
MVKQGNGPRDIGISIRGSNARDGFGIRNIQVLEDGFPVTQPDRLSRTDLTDPHAYTIIDVFRGPNSVMFGNYATGGAINFHTRPGRDIRGFEYGTDAGGFGYLNNYLTIGNATKDAEASLFVSNVRGNGHDKRPANDAPPDAVLDTPAAHLALRFAGDGRGLTDRHALCCVVGNQSTKVRHGAPSRRKYRDVGSIWQDRQSRKILRVYSRYLFTETSHF